MNQRGEQITLIERAANMVALAGFVVYAAAAPHSIAVSWVGIAILILALLVRLAATRRLGLRLTPMDLPLWLFMGWTVISCVLSIEPRESLPKLINASTFLMFYLTQSLLTRKRVVLIAGVMIASAIAGVLWGAGELIIGRGVVVARLAQDSPLRSETLLREGDVIWRVNNRRVVSVADIDEAIRQTPAGHRLLLSVISNGEHVEWPAMIVTEAMRRSDQPSGITGGGRSHRFRASGWTRHYQTFAEVVQIIAQLAFGFLLAGMAGYGNSSRRSRVTILLSAISFMVLAVGIALTAMRTTLVAFAAGALFNIWRASRRWRVVQLGFVTFIILVGAVVIWNTRARGALEFRDASSSLRLQVATVAVRRVWLHPIFGHGMDAVHSHWHEWGFPGDDMLDAHSTPLQIAFDRGLPALVLWIWLMFSFWRYAAATERRLRATGDRAVHGLSAGTVAALTGFLVSAMVNYNFGDSEVALLLWWMMGCVVILHGSNSNNAATSKLSVAA